MLEIDACDRRVEINAGYQHNKKFIAWKERNKLLLLVCKITWIETYKKMNYWWYKAIKIIAVDKNNRVYYTLTKN